MTANRLQPKLARAVFDWSTVDASASLRHLIVGAAGAGKPRGAA